MRRFTPLLVTAAIVLSTGAAYADLGDQLFKLLPNDGAAQDWFGFSVAISGTMVIVSAPADDDNGPDSGSAYLFTTASGRQIAKLLPNDGAAGDLFGFSAAISGSTAIVGAFEDDDNGRSSGSAYLFDAGAAPRGDMNCDGRLDGADIDPFFLALGDPAAYLLQFPKCDPLNGDMNGDGRLDGGDIDPFFACLGGGQCP
ncbi:MAG: FG-GAP repeat protein [Planctomycetes bacterium]|nr:FG-GAP repeat protein [Planctomycetota bacterium]